MRFGPEELAELRSARQEAFTQSCDVLNVPLEDHGYGGHGEGEPTVLGTHPCAVVPAGRAGQSGGEQVQAGRIMAVDLWAALLPFDATVADANRLKVFETDDDGERVGSGLLYEITGTSEGRSQPLELMVFCSRVG